MTRILITGGAGHIGGALAKRLSRNETYSVVIADNFQTSQANKVPVNSENPIQLIKADVNAWRDISAVMQSCSFDYIFHYAAMVGVARTTQDPTGVLRDIDGIKHVLSLAKNTGVKRVFYSSSSEVYGEPFEFPQNEYTTPLNSRLPYAIVKNVGEAFLRTFHREYGLDYTIFRFFNTYGPRQSEDFVITKFMRAALSGEPITLYGDGMQTRTFCHVDDNIETTIKCLEDGHVKNDVINVGSADELPIKELAIRIRDVVGSSSEIVHLPALEEGDMKRRQPDNSAMLRILQRDLIPLDEGLRQLVPVIKSA